jgi:hypothetical protein
VEAEYLVKVMLVEVVTEDRVLLEEEEEAPVVQVMLVYRMDQH